MIGCYVKFLDILHHPMEHIQWPSYNIPQQIHICLPSKFHSLSISNDVLRSDKNINIPTELKNVIVSRDDHSIKLQKGILFLNFATYINSG